MCTAMCNTVAAHVTVFVVLKLLPGILLNVICSITFLAVFSFLNSIRVEAGRIAFTTCEKKTATSEREERSFMLRSDFLNCVFLLRL